MALTIMAGKQVDDIYRITSASRVCGLLEVNCYYSNDYVLIYALDTDDK
jgi:hypothetical protein